MVTSKSSSSRKLHYYPPDLLSPAAAAPGAIIYQPCAVAAKNNGSNGAVIAASIVLIILLVFIVIAGLVYWSWSSCPTAAAASVDVDVVSSSSGGRYKQKKKKQVRFADKKGGELSECTADELVKIMNGKAEPCIIAFVSPMCGHCQNMKPALESAAKKSNISFYTLTNSGDPKESAHVMEAAKHLDVNGIPMLFRIENGKAIPYNGNRSEESLLEFAK